jgi:hypothetical protein
LKVNGLFRRNIKPTSSGFRALLATCFILVYLLGFFFFFFNPEDGGEIFLQKRRLPFNGIHSVMPPEDRKNSFREYFINFT